MTQLIRQLSTNDFQKIPAERKDIFITLFFTIFSTVTGVGIVVPLLPIYAHNLGAAGIYVAIIFASFSIARVIFLPLFGRLSDQKGRKPFIIAGLLGYVIVSIALVMSENVKELIFIRFTQGIASAMIMPVVQAYVGEITIPGYEGYAMGMFNLSMFFSLSLGPLMGGVLLDLWSIKGTFICMGILSFIGLILSSIYLPPLSCETVRQKARISPLPWSAIIKDWELAGLSFFRYTYTSCVGIIWCFLPLFASKNFTISGAQIGFLVTIGVLISGLLQLPMGILADRIDKKIMIALGGFLSASGMLLIFYAENFNNLLTSMAIFGLGGGISMPAITALAVLNGDRKKAMGSVMSVMTVAHSLGMLTGSVAAGLAMDCFSLRLAFPSGSITMILGLIGCLFMIMKK